MFALFFHSSFRDVQLQSSCKALWFWAASVDKLLTFFEHYSKVSDEVLSKSFIQDFLFKLFSTIWK